MSRKLVRTWLGKNLDPSIPDPVELRRERILIDPNLPNRRLRWQLATFKAVDVDLTAIRPGSRSSQRLKLILQLIGIVRQRIEVASVQHNRAPILIRVHADAVVPVRDANVLLLHRNRNGNV